MELKSKRGHQLILTNGLDENQAIITVELHTKWYNLFLVFPDGGFVEFEPDVFDVGYRDNTYNPYDLINFAQHNNYTIDEMALELIVGRWQIQTLNSYPNIEPNEYKWPYMSWEDLAEMVAAVGIEGGFIKGLYPLKISARYLPDEKVSKKVEEFRKHYEDFKYYLWDNIVFHEAYYGIKKSRG